MRLLDAGPAEFAGEGLNYVTVQVERDNRNGRRFYERAGFAEPRELTQDVQGYVLALVEYRRTILGGRRSSVDQSHDSGAVDPKGRRSTY